MSSTLQDLLMPDQVQIESISDTVAKVTVEPFERGFGHTLGNSLRRVLLSSISGCAVVEVEINGVVHEYMSIDGVQEDVTDIMLNLKGLAVILNAKNETTLSLHKSGVGPVLASDIQIDHDVVIANPEHVIATLTQPVTLDMQIKIERGRGYRPAPLADRESSLAIGKLKLDASFSPVRRVSYEVQSARVGQRTNMDKLVFEIESNGTIDPEMVVREAASILRKQLAIFVDLEETESNGRDATPDSEEQIEPILRLPIEELELTVRSINCLKSEHISYVGDLVQCSEQDLMRTPNLGKKSLVEIMEILKNHGLALDTTLKNWDLVKAQIAENETLAK